MSEHPFCEARLQGCGFRATECHHKRKRRGDDLFNPEFFMAVCRSCHSFIEDRMSMDEAVEKGFRIRSL